MASRSSPNLFAPPDDTSPLLGNGSSGHRQGSRSRAPSYATLVAGDEASSDVESESVTLDDTEELNEDCPPPPLNQFSRLDLCLILAALWSAIFLGALDGRSSASFSPLFLNFPQGRSLRRSSHVSWFHIIKWLHTACQNQSFLLAIGSHFGQSNNASYVGTSYLLSLCCFTPLYGMFLSHVEPFTHIY